MNDMRDLFVSDLDGTLLNSQSRISDASAQIISSLSRGGALISVATARTPATVVPLLQSTYTSIPAIVMTGAAMWNREKSCFVEPRYLSATVWIKVMETLRCCGLNPMAYEVYGDKLLHCYIHGKISVKEQKFIDQRSHLPLKRVYVNGSEPDADSGRHILVIALGDSRHVNRAAELLRQYDCSVSSYLDIFNKEVAYIEVFAQGVSKASAMMRLKEILGANTLTVFGDNLNDLPMMAVADVAVAVENALPQVKEAADIVIGSNDSDAVAKYISEQIQILK